MGTGEQCVNSSWEDRKVPSFRENWLCVENGLFTRELNKVDGALFKKYIVE